MGQLFVPSVCGASHDRDCLSAHQACSLPSRFRGALLGLALSLTTFPCDSQVQEQLLSEEARISLWGLSLGMLRHHDSWESRWQWLLSEAASSSLTLVQALFMGDLIEQVLCRGLLAHSNQSVIDQSTALDVRGRLRDFTHLENRLARYNLPTEAQQYYRKAYANVANGLSFEQSQDALSQDVLIGGVLCGLQPLQSYGLAVQRAAQLGQQAVLVAGLFAGARGAEVAIPVLWQLRSRTSLPTLNCAEVIAIANQLFNQWSGVLSV